MSKKLFIVLQSKLFVINNLKFAARDCRASGTAGRRAPARPEKNYLFKLEPGPSPTKCVLQSPNPACGQNRARAFGSPGPAQFPSTIPMQVNATVPRLEDQTQRRGLQWRSSELKRTRQAKTNCALGSSGVRRPCKI